MRPAEIGSSPQPSVPDWLPDWIGAIDAALWMCDPGGQLVYLNPKAESLLACGSDSQWSGRPCHLVVRGESSSGGPHCKELCHVREQAGRGAALAPLSLRLESGDGPRIQVLCIPLTAPDGSAPWLLHCALDPTHPDRYERYLRWVACRFGTPADPAGALASLTKREQEILHLLTLGEEPNRIAYELHLSRATVRNHIQHILRKLDVHSVQEAVAQRLLYE